MERAGYFNHALTLVFRYRLRQSREHFPWWTAQPAISVGFRRVIGFLFHVESLGFIGGYVKGIIPLNSLDFDSQGCDHILYAFDL